ncbi:MAG: hypothetical protein ABIB47_04965 [Candidatus Woesearchaeota archaeon]
MANQREVPGPLDVRVTGGGLVRAPSLNMEVVLTPRVPGLTEYIAEAGADELMRMVEQLCGDSAVRYRGCSLYRDGVKAQFADMSEARRLADYVNGRGFLIFKADVAPIPRG